MELHLPRATKFACPILKYAEIADCLRDINLAITEDDIMKPNKDRLVAIYEFFLETLVDISKERLDELTSIALESAEFPDVIYRSVRLEVLAKHVAQLMAYLGVDDFGLCDIIRAEPGRTRRIFSAIINFLRFREDHVAAFEQLCQQSEQYTVEAQQLQSNILRLEEEIERIRKKHEQDEPVVEKLKENNRELRAELAALNEQEELLKREQAELKRARHELVTHNAELEQEMNLVEQQIVALQARIVKSPEAIQQGILDVRERIKLEKLRIDDENIKTITVQARIDVLLHVAQELKSYQKLLEPCQAEIANISQVLKDIRRTSDDLSLIKTQVEARKRENASTESQIRQLQDKQLKYRHGHEERLHGIQERIDELKQKHEDGREKNMAVQESMAALNEKIAQADTKLVEVRRTAQNRLKRIKTDFETMELVVSNYEQECRRVLEGGL